MKKVLIVDDDQGFILSLQDMFKEHADTFQVITAGNGKEALEILQNQAISLLVTDLKMPVMDGFQLVSQMSRLSNIVPVIAMTAFGTPEMEDRLMNMGAFQYIEKPIDFGQLLEKIQEGLKAGFKGHVSGISLPSFLQLLELDKKTCTIMAKSGARTGLLFFQNGELINAYTEPIEGLDAAFEIISWEQAEIEIYNFCQNRKRTIEVPLGFILIEGARLSDERAEKMAKEGGAPAGDELDQLDDLDFATAPPPPLEMPPELSDDPMHVLEHKLNTTVGIIRMIVVGGDGSVKSQKNIDNKEFKTFVTYVAMAADKIRAILGQTNLPGHIMLTQEQGEKLLILPGPNLSVGIEMQAEVSPTKIMASIAPALAQAQA